MAALWRCFTRQPPAQGDYFWVVPRVVVLYKFDCISNTTPQSETPTISLHELASKFAHTWACFFSISTWPPYIFLISMDRIFSWLFYRIINLSVDDIYQNLSQKHIYRLPKMSQMGVYFFNMIFDQLRYFNFEPSFEVGCYCAWDLFGSQILVTTGGFELWISYIQSSHLTH